MNRRKLLTLLGLPALATFLGGAYAARARGTNPYYNGPVSDHFDGLHFSDGRPVTKGFREFFRWQLEGGREAWPASYPAPAPAKPPSRAETLRVTHVGHASFLIQTAGLNIVVDPLWSDRASPVSFAGPRRANPPGIAFDDLPKVDVILITHNHYDHLDLATIHRIFDRDRARIIAPLGNDAIIRDKRPDIPVEARDWGDTLALGPGVDVTLVPAYHWSARGAFDRRMALWASYVIGTPDGRIYHIGDTGYHDGAFFRQHGEAFGPFRLAILPIGAYEPRWFMAAQHTNPEEAVLLHKLMESGMSVGMHWGCWQLTDEPREAPLKELAEARVKHGVDEKSFLTGDPGAVWIV